MLKLPIRPCEENQSSSSQIVQKKMVVENSNFTILHYWYEYPNKKNATPSNYNLLLNREFL